MSEPWFARGLRFECTACGECCRREGDVLFSRDEALRAVRLVYGPDATVEAFTGELWVEEPDGSLRIEVQQGEGCPFLSADRRCKVHAIKPRQCRTYPFWPEIVASRQAWDAEREYCEGIGWRTVVDANTVARLLNESES